LQEIHGIDVRLHAGLLGVPETQCPTYKDLTETCPSLRPPAPGFVGCPAFIGVVDTPKDMRDRLLKPVSTCVDP
jgi:hypothetical protein